MLSVIYAERRNEVDYAECHALSHYAERHYAECHYAECHYAECHMLSVVTLNVVMLNVVASDYLLVEFNTTFVNCNKPK